jgi:hypothetical protein
MNANAMIMLLMYGCWKWFCKEICFVGAACNPFNLDRISILFVLDLWSPLELRSMLAFAQLLVVNLIPFKLVLSLVVLVVTFLV